MIKTCKKTCNSNQICNPETGRCVLRGGVKGKKIESGKPRQPDFQQPTPDKPPTTKPRRQEDICEKFKKDPSVNPRTGRKITKTGKIYKELVKECDLNSQSSSEPRSHILSHHTPTVNSIKDMLESIQKNPKNIVEICTGLYQKHQETRDNNIKRFIRYDAYFLASVATILGVEEPIAFGSTVVNTKKFDPKNEFGVSSKMNFFLEDIFSVTPEELYKENAKFEKTGVSYLFKSNIVNISLMLMCYATRCFDMYFSKVESRYKDVDLDTMFTNYSKKIGNLLESLIIAYSTLTYESLKTLYINYLQFYINYIKVFKLESYIKTNIQSILESISDSGRDYYIYLSCNLQPDFKMVHILPTKFAVSHIGFRPAHEFIFNTLDVIFHDFFFHKAVQRIKNTTSGTRDEMAQFVIKLFHSNAYELGSTIYWNIQNEIEHERPVSVSKIINDILGFNFNCRHVYQLLETYDFSTFKIIDERYFTQSKISLVQWQKIITFLLYNYGSSMGDKQADLYAQFIENPNKAVYNV